MASPQTENGFVMIALDLFVALMTADIPNADAIVVAELIVQHYGPAKKRDVVVDQIWLEEMTGLHRNNCRAALKSLVAANVVVRNDDGTYRFQKDWEAWKPKGKPFTERLGGGLARFARHALARFGRIKKSKKDPIQRDRVGTAASTQDPIHLDRPGKPEVNPTGSDPRSNGIGSDADASAGIDDGTGDFLYGLVDIPACERAPASEDLINTENSDGCFAADERESVATTQAPTTRTAPKIADPPAWAAKVLSATPGGPPDPSMEPPYPAPGFLIDVTPGPHAVPDADAREIFSMLWKLAGSARVCNGFFQRQQEFPPDVWRRAVKDLALSNSRPGSIEYVVKKAVDVERKAAAPSQRVAQKRPPRLDPAEKARLDADMAASL